MLKATVYVVVALVLIVLGIAVKQGWFGEAENTQHETTLPVIAPVPGGTIMEFATSSSTQLHGSNNAASVQSSAVLMHSAGPELPNRLLKFAVFSSHYSSDRLSML